MAKNSKMKARASSKMEMPGGYHEGTEYSQVTQFGEFWWKGKKKAKAKAGHSYPKTMPHNRGKMY